MMQPLVPLLGDVSLDASLDDLVRRNEDYFLAYPEISFISAASRALLFALIRKNHFQSVAELGTFFGGTTEVMARALWENGGGALHTVDAYNEGRFTKAVAAWPQPLRDLTEFHPMYSMAFFGAMVRRKITFDFVLVDANHDFEYALFDLQMAAKLMRQNGIVAMDNCDQAGPFRAAQVFLQNSAGWRELGSAIERHDPFDPFGGVRSSYPDTTLILLQAPPLITIGAAIRSWERSTPFSTVHGLTLDMPAQTTEGVLAYCITLRGFTSAGRDNTETHAKGDVRLKLFGDTPTLARHELTAALTSRLATDGHHKVEIGLSWQGTAPLVLAQEPTATGIA